MSNSDTVIDYWLLDNTVCFNNPDFPFLGSILQVLPKEWFFAFSFHLVVKRLGIMIVNKLESLTLFNICKGFVEHFVSLGRREGPQVKLVDYREAFIS